MLKARVNTALKFRPIILLVISCLQDEKNILQLKYKRTESLRLLGFECIFSVFLMLPSMTLISVSFTEKRKLLPI